MRGQTLLTAGAVFFLSLAAPIRAGEPAGPERILSYESEITVHPDAWLTVKETIRVVAKGNQIKRGIYRDFPTIYKTSRGFRTAVAFEVVEVLRDGEPEKYRMDNAALKNGVRVWIGRPDVLLDPGTYTYAITYRTNRQLGFFEDHDELYWNVTGNNWTFSMETVSASVALPEAVPAGAIKVEGGALHFRSSFFMPVPKHQAWGHW